MRSRPRTVESADALGRRWATAGGNNEREEGRHATDRDRPAYARRTYRRDTSVLPRISAARRICPAACSTKAVVSNTLSTIPRSLGAADKRSRSPRLRRTATAFSNKHCLTRLWRGAGLRVMAGASSLGTTSSAKRQPGPRTVAIGPAPENPAQRRICCCSEFALASTPSQTPWKRFFYPRVRAVRPTHRTPAARAGPAGRPPTGGVAQEEARTIEPVAHDALGNPALAMR